MQPASTILMRHQCPPASSRLVHPPATLHGYKGPTKWNPSHLFRIVHVRFPGHEIEVMCGTFVSPVYPDLASRCSLVHLLVPGRKLTLGCPVVVIIRNGRPVRTTYTPPRLIHPISLRTDFQVTKNLPNVTWPLARNWAGNIPVQREGHPNDTLFFWAFESSNGSFTATSDKPWGIWLNGG